jgi:hypothetical protein
MIKISRSNVRSMVCLRLPTERARQPRGGSSGKLDGQSVINPTLLERLELENAELRGKVLHLVLQIQSLRDGDH